MTKLFMSLEDHAEVTPRRPPGARDELSLADLCVHCGDCVRVCPEGRLALSSDGVPMVLGTGACVQCGLCADVCSHGAIELTRRTRTGLEMVRRLERLMDTQKKP